MECLASHNLNITSGHSGARAFACLADVRRTFGPSLPGNEFPPLGGPSACLILGNGEGTPRRREKISRRGANKVCSASVLGSPSRHRTTDISQDERTTDLELGYPIEYNGWFSGPGTGVNYPYNGPDRAISPKVSRQLSYPSRRHRPCTARLKWQSPKCGCAVSLPLVAVAR
jgi:hypothetical protein